MSARRVYRGIELVALDRQFLSNRAAIPSELQVPEKRTNYGAQRLVRNWHSFGRSGEKRKVEGKTRRRSFANVTSGPDDTVGISYKLSIKRHARDSRAMVSRVPWKSLSRIEGGEGGVIRNEQEMGYI